MAEGKKVNGKYYDWADITINLPHGQLVDVHGIEYSDKLEKELVYGKGGKPVGWARGNYEAEGKLTLLLEEWEKFREWASGQGRTLFQLDPFPITVAYADDGSAVTTDTLKQCILTERSTGPKQGDKGLEVELSFLIVDGIDSNGYEGYKEPH